MLRKLIDSVSGKIGLQPFYEMLYRASVYGMNYGNGGDFQKSGERYVIQYIKNKLHKNAPITIFDVGANKGHYALEMAQEFADRNVTIHCFEPSKVTFEYLKKTVAANSHILTNNFGLSEKEETLTLYTNNPLSGLASIYHRQLDHIGIKMDTVEEVALKKIDDYCLVNNIQQIDFLKMDIEGHEFKCLKGAKEMLTQKKIRFIQFEFGGCNIDSRTFFQDFWYLLHKEYNFYRIVKNGLAPIESYNERLEVFKNINFFAALK